MIEIPYEMLIVSEMLNTQMTFCKNASKSINDYESATEGLSDPQFRAVLGASTNYIVSSSITKIKKSLKAFVNELRNFVNGQLNKMLVRIGIDETYCIDRSNVTEFLNHNWDRIIDVQRTINAELRILKRGSMMKSDYRSRSDLDTKIRVVAADFERWKKHTEPKKVEVKDVKTTVSKFKDMINELNIGIKDLEIVELRLQSMIDVPQSIGYNISSLLTVMTYTVNVYTILANSLESAIEPISRLKMSSVNAVKTLNPLDRYDDDVDIKAARGY